MITNFFKGAYDFERLINGTDTDLVDYLSAKISIVNIPNKNKGVVANDFIRRGELLSISKPLSTNNDRDDKSYSIKFFSATKKMLTKNQCQNVANIVYKMQFDPDYARKIYSLDPGAQYPREYKGDYATIDVERIESIFSTNSFGYIGNIKTPQQVF